MLERQATGLCRVLSSERVDEHGVLRCRESGRLDLRDIRIIVDSLGVVDRVVLNRGLPVIRAIRTLYPAATRPEEDPPAPQKRSVTVRPFHGAAGWA